MDQQSIFDNEKRRIADEKDRVFKRTLVLSLAFLIVNIVIFSAQTFAFFTDSVDNGQNVIEAGNLGVEIIELAETNGSEEAYTDPVFVMPSMTVSKIVKIQNTGNLPTYVRVLLNIAIDDEENRDIPSDWRKYIEFVGLSDDWEYRDGYYYYKKPLQKGTITEELFRSVRFSPEMGNGFENSEIVLTVRVEATQVNGNGANVFEAQGWPTPNDSNETTN